MRVRGVRRLRQIDRENQLIGLKVGIYLWRGSRQTMEVRNPNHAFTFLSAHANRCAKRSQSYCHIRRMHGDALLAGAKDRVATMDAFAPTAASSRRSFIALGKCRIHEVRAARPLEKVAAIRSQIAQLR